MPHQVLSALQKAQQYKPVALAKKAVFHKNGDREMVRR
jgi:hypothetical protein